MAISDLEKIVSEIERLWKEHLSDPLPPIDSEIDDEEGVELHELDTYIAGCVTTFIGAGSLDTGRTAILGLCYRDALVAQSVFTGAERRYSARLEQLAELVLRAVVLKNQIL
jgi:hypothetical protein